MKKVLFYLLLFICSFSTATFAQSYRRVSEKEALYIAQKQFTGKDVDYSTPSGIILENDTIPLSIRQADVANRLSMRYPFRSNNADEVREQPVYLNVTTTAAGQLAEKVGDDINNVDSLIVNGPINDTDFYTLWSGTFYGRLSVINLENAEIINGVIPEWAFCRPKEQVIDGYIYSIGLRRIIFPEGLKVIGQSAFNFVDNLKYINIPTSLQRIERSAFENCWLLKTNPLVFPEGFEKLEERAFMNCSELKGSVVLPSTIKEIGALAFYLSKITSINFPEGLEEIGNKAFFDCRFKEVVISNPNIIWSGESQFGWNLKLEKISLPEEMTYIPPRFLEFCIELKDFRIPSDVKVIKSGAFNECYNLQKLELPAGLEEIEDQAFSECNALEEIVFPASLKTLGAESCTNWTNIKRIYSMAAEPPVCKVNMNSGATPFYPGTPNNIPVYVPTGTAEKYRNAKGWDYFTNFIETDDFPTSTINDINIEQQESKQGIYDLSGRKVTTTEKGKVYIINGKKVITDNNSH